MEEVSRNVLNGREGKVYRRRKGRERDREREREMVISGHLVSK